MKEQDLDEIGRFLTMVGKATLFDYIEVPPEATEPAVDQAIKKRRTWAQGQQANPKFRAEALWIIKNQRLLQLALIEEKDQYLGSVRSRDEQRSLEVLSLFIRGTLSSGSLSPAGEEAIQEQGRSLGLSEQSVRMRIDELLVEHGASRPSVEAFVDHYAALGVDASASAEEIEQAYRARYRWARNLADKKKTRDAYASLDAALRDLKDPERRAAYDRRYTEHTGRSAGPPEEGPTAYLPPPSDPPGGRAEPTVHSAPSLSAGPRLAPARSDREEHTEPPGAAPPVKRPGPAREGVPPAEAAAPAAVPRPPDALVGRTLSLEQTRDATRLELSTAPEVHLNVGRGTVAREIGLRQVGPGTVTARVLADRNWVTVEPTRLGPGGTEHTITATIHPGRMPKTRGTSVVTIVPSHGPRLSVTLDVERRGNRLPLVGIALVLLLLVGIGLGLRFLLPMLESASSTGEQQARTLIVRPDPPTAYVSLGAELLGEGQVEIDEDRLPDGAIELRVELDGFRSHSQTVDLAAGQRLELNPTLELLDPLTFVPSDSLEGKPLPASSVRQVLAAHPRLFDACFVPGSPPRVHVLGYVDAAGHVRGITSADDPAPDGALVRCIGRGLRALVFLGGEPADYWTLDTTIMAPAP